MTQETKYTPMRHYYLAERDRGMGYIDYAVMCDYSNGGSQGVTVAGGLSHKHAYFSIRIAGADAELVKALENIAFSAQADTAPTLRGIAQDALTKARGSDKGEA